MFFAEEFNKTALSSNDGNRIQSVDYVETCTYGISKDLIFKKEKAKCNNIIKQCKN